MSLQDDLTGFRQQLEGLSRAIAALRANIGDLEKELTNTIDPSHRPILFRRLEEVRRDVNRLEDERSFIQAKIKKLVERIELSPRLQQVPIQHWDLLWDLKRMSPFPEIHSFVWFPPMIQENVDELKQYYLASGYHNYAIRMPEILRHRRWRAVLNLYYSPPPPPPNFPPLSLPPPCYMPSICQIGINVHEFCDDSCPAELLADRTMLEAIAQDRIYASLQAIDYAAGGLFGTGQDLRLCQGHVLSFDELWVAHLSFAVISRVTYQPQTTTDPVRSFLGQIIDGVLRKLDQL